MARIRALDYLRREDLAEACEEPESLVAETVCDNDPQDLLCAIQKNKLLNEALLQLEPVQRQLIAMVFFRGLTHEEITAFTGIALVQSNHIFAAHSSSYKVYLWSKPSKGFINEKTLFTRSREFKASRTSRIRFVGKPRTDSS